MIHIYTLSPQSFQTVTSEKASYQTETRKKNKEEKKHENLNEIKGSASPDSQCDDTLLDLIWKGLNVLKCKWLDAWKPKWEARFYMGQRQEDYRTEINRGKKEGAILMWIV